VKKAPRTKGTKSSGATINLPKGTYRAVVSGNCGLAGARPPR
jgi:hypothetical protein